MKMQILPVLSFCATFGCVLAGPINQTTGIEIQSRDQDFVCTGYSNACYRDSLGEVKPGVYGPVFGAFCHWNGKGWASTLDLNGCIRNFRGHMYPGKDGNFYTDCEKLEYDAGTTLLTAKCKDTGGDKIATELILDSIIGMHNGALCCYDHVAEAMEYSQGDPFLYGGPQPYPNETF
ncbi:hypothetical protein GGS24DRAFT_505325 [Hypoxylon argillaceum]|nr:hypothetical protein GGS24DRAFT_505325 [Hypoxylon argillaceum]